MLDLVARSSDSPADAPLASRRMYRALHDDFAVPYSVLQYLHRAFLQRQRESPATPSPAAADPAALLLAHMMNGRRAAQQHNKSTLPKALFVTVYASRLESRIRATASAIAFADVTGRVPVVLWGLHPASWTLSWTRLFADISAINERAVFLDVPLNDFFDAPHAEGGDHHNPPRNRSSSASRPPTRPGLRRTPKLPRNLSKGNGGSSGTRHIERRQREQHDARLSDNQAVTERSGPQDISRFQLVRKLGGAARETPDWAELSVLDVDEACQTVPNKVNSISTDGLSRSNPDPQRGPVDGKSEHGRTICSVACIDSHVAVAISDELRSRYAPRSLAAALVSSRGMLRGAGVFADYVGNAYPLEYTLSAISDQDIAKSLHKDFRVPLVLLSGLSSAMQRKLLASLILKRESTENPRAIFVHAQFGLGNRLRALGSAMAFGKETNRVVVLIWIPDHHLNCFFSDLFVDEGDLIVSDGSALSEEWPFNNAKSYDAAAYRAVTWYNFMKHNGKHVRQPSELVNDQPLQHIYISTAYVIQSPAVPFIGRARSPYWRHLRSLTPQVNVARLIERYGGLPMHKVMGIHIRSKSIKTDIAGVGTAEYSDEASSRTDYWRNLTQVETFIREMKKQPQSQIFYVAADKVETLVRMDAEFPSRVLYTPRQCDSRERECLQYAMADIYILSRCATIRGSYWSSFSELSLRLGAGSVLLAGVDFGKPAASAKSRPNLPRSIRHARFRHIHSRRYHRYLRRKRRSSLARKTRLAQK